MGGLSSTLPAVLSMISAYVVLTVLGIAESFASFGLLGETFFLMTCFTGGLVMADLLQLISGQNTTVKGDK